MHKHLSLLFLGITLAAPVCAADLDEVSVRLFQAQVARAEKGDANDQYYLGEMYEHGLGTKQDVEQATEWYSKAAAQGNALAKKKLHDLARAKTEAARIAREHALREQQAQEPEPAKAADKPRAEAAATHRTATPVKTPNAEDIAARRRAAREAYEKARAEQKKADGLWQ